MGLELGGAFLVKIYLEGCALPQKRFKFVKKTDNSSQQSHCPILEFEFSFVKWEKIVSLKLFGNKIFALLRFLKASQARKTLPRWQESNIDVVVDHLTWNSGNHIPLWDLQILTASEWILDPDELLEAAALLLNLFFVPNCEKGKYFRRALYDIVKCPHLHKNVAKRLYWFP